MKIEKLERRILSEPIQIETRGGEGDTPGEQHLVGYAVVFDKRSENLGGFIEEIDPQAFDGIKGKTDARALFDHDSSKLLGRESSGTLKLEYDSKGLKYDVQLPNTTTAADLVELITRGDITGSSFGFTTKTDQWTEGENGEPTLRRITEIDALYDVSPVTFPAYPDTAVALRSLEALKPVPEPAPKEEKIDHEAESRKRELDILDREILPVGDISGISEVKQ